MADQKFHCEKGHIWIGSTPICPLHGTPAIEAPKAPNKTDRKTGVPIPQEHGVPRIPTGSSKTKTKTKPKQVKSQRLYCQIGKHEWRRPPQRGKPPRNCPEHQPAKPEPSERKPRNVDGDGTKTMARPKILTLSEIRQQYPNVDDESARVFAYVENEVSAPTWPRGREQEDINLLVKTYNNRLRAVARSSHAPGPVPVEA